MNSDRPSVLITTRVLTIGSLSAAALLGLGLLLGLAGADEVGGFIGNIGVVFLLLTPVAGLVATWFELRPVRPANAWISLAVLGVLSLATVIALLARP